MKFKCLLAAFSVLFLQSSWAASSPVSTQPLDKIVAVVNSDIVTESELNQQLNAAKQQLQSTGAPLPDPAKLRSEVLDQLINQKMILMLAKRNNLTVSDADVDRSIAMIASRNNLTPAQFKVELQKHGMNYDTFRKQIRTQMLMQQVEEHALSPIQVSPAEVKAFLKQQPNVNAQYQIIDYYLSPSIAQQSQTIVQQLQTSTAAPAGVTMTPLGWRDLNGMPQIFAEKVVTMKVNDVAGPIQAPNGMHFIKLVGIKSSGQKLTEDQARQILLQRKFTEKLTPWLKQLRATAYIKIM